MSDLPFGKEDFEALSAFRYQVRRYLRWSELLTRRKGVTNLQYLLLLHLKGFPGREWATITELAERLQARHHGVVALVSRCEKSGWVERHAGRADGRQVEVHLTRKGARVVETIDLCARGVAWGEGSTAARDAVAREIIERLS